MLQTIYNYVMTHGVTVGLFAVCICSVIQIAPIQVNPWSWILKKVGNLMYAEIREEIKQLENKIDNLSNKVDGNEREADMRRISTLRWSIINFAHILKEGQSYSSSAFDHIYDEHREYLDLLKKYNMTNGQTESAMKVVDEYYRK